MLTETVIVAIITGGFAFLGSLIANSKTEAVLQEKIDQLEKKQDKHNQLIERMYKLESDVKTAWKRIDENREDIDKLEDKI